MVKVTLFALWKDRERALGRKIPAGEIAAEIGVSRNTLTAYFDGKVKRPDLEVVDKLCRYFDIDTGAIPFLIYERD